MYPKHEAAEFQLLLQAPVATAILAGPEHMFELANPLFCRMVGQSDLVGRTYGEAFPHLVGTPLYEILDRVYQSGEPFVTSEYKVPLDRHGNGTIEDAYFTFNLEPLRDRTGAVYGIMAIGVEITEQVRTRQALEIARTLAVSSEQQVRVVIDTIPVLAWTARADGWIDFYNRRWYDYTGTTPEQMEGWGWQSVHDPVELPRVMERWGRSISTGEPFEMRFPLRRGDGVLRWHLTRVQPLRDVHGAVVRWFGSNIDIDEQVRDEQEAKRLQESVKRSLEAERKARAEADVARNRASWLDSITKQLVEDLEGSLPTVERLANIVVPGLADWCAVYAPGDGGQIEIVALAHIDPAKTELAKRMLERYPLDPNQGWGIPEIMRTGKPELVTEITDEMLTAVAKDPEHLQLMRELGMTSHVAVALRAHGKVIGCLGLTQTESGRRFVPDDVLLAEEIGVRAALMMEQEALYEATLAARAEAESANRTKDEFLAMLGHELRNPLAPIVTALELMKLRHLGGDKERSVIEHQVDHLIRLVDDLLDVSRITSGKIELHRAPIEVSDVVTKAIEMVSPIFEQRHHDLIVAVPAQGLVVDGDAVRLAQIVSNLLTNAAKYSDRGSRIDVIAERDAEQVVLRVIDRGVGIAPEIMPRLFDLFSQEQQSIDRSQGGLGIGLAIVRNLVMLHGGTVTAESAGKGHGATLTVRLPLVTASEATVHTAGSKPVPSPASGRRILIVDDNVDAAEMLAESLSSMGHHIRVAHDGPSALQIAKQFVPELALLDIGLPVMDGYELGQLLRREHDLDKLHLVSITGYGQAADRARSQAAGFDKHLVKPVSIAQIQSVVASLP